MKRKSTIEEILNPIVIVTSLLFSWAIIYIGYFLERRYAPASLTVQLLSQKRAWLFVAVFIISMLLLGLISDAISAQDLAKSRRFKQRLYPILITGLLVLIFRAWYYSNFINYVVYYDTPTYTNYPFNILHLQVDVFRTPGYPLYLKLIGFLSGSEPPSADYYNAVVYSQMLLSLISVIILYLALKKLFKNEYVICTLCLIYGCAPCVISWDICVLTESLSLFCTVLLIYLILSYLKKPSVTMAVIIGLFSFLMIMVRPTFVYLFAILAVFWVTRFILCRFDRKRALAGALALLLSGVLTLSYCGLVKQNYGYFTLSSVGTTVNRLYMVMMNRITDNPDYPEITEYIETAIKNPENDNYVIDIIEPAAVKFDYADIAGYVEGCISSNKDVFNKYTADKFISLATTNIAVQYSTYNPLSGNFAPTDNIFMFGLYPFTFMQLVFLVLLTVILAVILLIRKKRVAWQAIGLSALLFTHIFVSIYGSMAEFPRLAVMAVPISYVLVFYYIDLLAGLFRRKNIEIRLETGSDDIEIFSDKPPAVQPLNIENNTGDA